MEQLSVDMPSWNPVTGEESDVTLKEMQERVNEGLNLLDERANVAAMRLLQAYDLIKFFPVEVQAMIIEVVDVLTGKADAEYVVKRWQASREETAELEAARAAFAATVSSGDTDGMVQP